MQSPPEVIAIALEVAQHRRAIPRESSQWSHDHRVAVSTAAYCRAECRGFKPGHELEDWLAAEEQVRQRLSGEGRSF